MPSYQFTGPGMPPRPKLQIPTLAQQNGLSVMPTTFHNSQSSIESLQLHLGIFQTAETAPWRASAVKPKA
jgi:hypothetical protein